MTYEKLRKLKDEFFVYSANNLFLDARLDFETFCRDWTYYVGGTPFLGTDKTPSKFLYLDADGVINAYREDGISSNYLNILAETNLRIGERIDLIKSLLNEIMNISRAQGVYISKMGMKTFTGPKIEELMPKSLLTNFERSVEKLSRELRECKLTEEEHTEAGRIAVEKTVLATNIFPALAELEKEMSFEVWIVSAGPDAAIKELGKELQIPSTRINASTFEFHKGLFKRLYSNAGIRKKLEKESHDGCVFVTDDYHTDFRIACAFGLGLVTLTTHEVEKFPGRIYVRLPEMREDFKELSKFIRRYELARVYTWFLSPTATKELCTLIKQMNKDAKLCVDSTNDYEVYSYGGRVRERVEKFLSLVRPVFPEYSYGMRELLDELSFTKDTEKYKKIVVEIINGINKSPLAKADENFIRGLEKYVEDWEEYERTGINGIH